MRQSNFSQIKKGAIVSYLGIFISTIAALLYTPWMKNQIGDAYYGLYTLVGSLVAIFIMDFGLGTSVTRFLSKYRAENDKIQINNVLGYVFKLYFIIDIFIILALCVVYCLIDNIYVGLSITEREVFKTIYLIFGTYSVLAFPFTPLSGILNAYEKFAWMKLCELFQKLFSIFLIVLVLITNHGVIALVLMNAIAGIVTVMIKLLIIGKGKLVKPNFRVKDKALLSELFAFSIWVTVLALAQRLIFNIAPSILGVTSNSTEIAKFAPASQLEGYFFSFAYAINGLFMPTIARLDHDTDNKGIESIMINVGRYQMGILGLLFVGVCTMGTDFIELWMGKEYHISGACTIFLLAPSIFLYSQQIANTLLSLRNKIKYQAISMLIVGTVNVAISFCLTPFWGAFGASISICIAFFVNLILLNVVYRRVLKLDLDLFYKKVFFRYTFIMFGAILILLFFFKILHVTGWFGLAIKLVVCTLVYLTLIMVFGLNTQERRIVKSKILRRTK